jgi:hypothetical protein
MTQNNGGLFGSAIDATIDSAMLTPNLTPEKNNKTPRLDSDAESGAKLAPFEAVTPD